MTLLMTTKKSTLVATKRDDGGCGGFSPQGQREGGEIAKVTKKRGGSEKARGTGGKSLDSRRFKAQRRAELEMPSEATATIRMPTSR
jgi:hypothetical protein